MYSLQMTEFLVSVDVVLALDPKASLSSNAPGFVAVPGSHDYFVSNGKVLVGTEFWVNGIMNLQQRRKEWRQSRIVMCTSRACACGKCFVSGTYPMPGLHMVLPNPPLPRLREKKRKVKLFEARTFDEIKK